MLWLALFHRRRLASRPWFGSGLDLTVPIVSTLFSVCRLSLSPTRWAFHLSSWVLDEE